MQDMQETRVQSLGQEDPLEEEMQPTPVFLPGKSHGPEEPGGFTKSQTQLSTQAYTHSQCNGYKYATLLN